MPGASYINFNAGTEGAVMVEGRISSSAIVGAGSDVGGGASILRCSIWYRWCSCKYWRKYTYLVLTLVLVQLVGDSCIVRCRCLQYYQEQKLLLSEKSVAALIQES